MKRRVIALAVTLWLVTMGSTAIAASLAPQTAVPDPTSTLLVYGPLGIFVALFAMGIIVAKPTIERERHLTDVALANNEKLVGAIDRLTEAIYRGQAE